VPKIYYENWLAVDKDIAKIVRLTFSGPPCMYQLLLTIHSDVSIINAQTTATVELAI